MNSASYRFQIGQFDCLIIKDGTEDSPPLSRYMQTIPNELEGHHIYMLGGLMLIETNQSRILIDAGNEPGERGRTHFASMTFREVGLVPESIDTVLVTHGDPDHIGGLFTQRGELAYPNARYVLHQDLWDAWHARPNHGSFLRIRQRSSPGSPCSSQAVLRLSDPKRTSHREFAPSQHPAIAVVTPSIFWLDGGEIAAHRRCRLRSRLPRVHRFPERPRY